MSNKERIYEKLKQKRQLESEVVTLLLTDPNCLKGKLLNEEAYQVAIDYFVEKEERGQATAEANPAGADAIKLGVLIDCYTDANKSGKLEYARKIALFLQQTPTKWLKQIPEETKDIAFDIVMQYLESQMCS